MNFSILILTLNEEASLPACLDSIKPCDDIVVIDSFSTDATEAVAGKAGARFVQRKFDNFASQRNFGLREIDYKHPWVFHLDADERMTPELIAECNQATANNAYDGYYVPSRMMLAGRWLKHSGGYPAYQMRFARRGAMEFVQHGHGQREASAGRVGFLTNPIIHYSFSKGFEDWWERHNRYSSDEARQNLKELEEDSGGIGKVISSNSIERRRAIKRLSARLPFRPWMKFFYMYFLRMGFLDGRAGLTYCALQAVYEYMIAVKVAELKRRKAGLAL